MANPRDFSVKDLTRKVALARQIEENAGNVLQRAFYQAANPPTIDAQKN